MVAGRHESRDNPGMSDLPEIMRAASALFAGAGMGSAIVVVMVVSASAFEKLDYGRADRHVRLTLSRTHPWIAAFAGLAGVLAVVGGAVAAAGVNAVVAVLALFAQWALAPKDREELPAGMRQRHKTARIVSAALTIMLAPVLAIAGILAVIGV